MGMLGLFLILLGWIIQLIHLEKKQQLNILFLLAYSSGTSFLVIDSFLSGSYLFGSMNLLIMSVVSMVLFKFKKY